MEWQRSKWDGNAGVMGTKRKATRRARAMHVSTNWFQIDTVTEVGSMCGVWEYDTVCMMSTVFCQRISWSLPHAPSVAISVANFGSEFGSENEILIPFSWPACLPACACLCLPACTVAAAATASTSPLSPPSLA